MAFQKLKTRPTLKPAQLEKFFADAGVLSVADKKSLSELHKKSAAALWYLDRGEIRVWDASAGVNVWVKHAILGYFKSSKTEPQNAGIFEYNDKLPAKTRTFMKDVRVVPGAVVRYGSFLEPGVIAMPCFVNIGARVGSGTMIDTWATVGSCAQIGKSVHLSGGVGIGGVLEPAMASPVIVEDGAFIGSRCIIVEGVQVKKEAVLGAGVVLTNSTKIVDVRGSEPIISTGVVPERAVVIPGTLPKSFPAGEYGVPCALIIGTRSASTDLKTSLNQTLRAHSLSV